MDGTGIVATAVARRFGDVEAVRSMDLRAGPGEVTALIGPNGAGKTTLLLILATLLTPDAGQIRIAGYDPVADPDEVRARMGWSPDVFGLYDGLTAREYLEFFGAAYRLPKPRAQDRARELLAVARLEAFADRPVHVLSRGQKQRLGLMRALVHDPEVLVLDEPASGLDPRSRVELRDLLRGLAAAGTAVLVSSHALADLEELAHRVVFVDAGRSIGEHRIDALPDAARPRPWRLRAIDGDRLVAALAQAGVAHGQPTSGGIDVALLSDEDAAELVARLVADGVRLVSIAPVGGALEATFLELTEDRR
ncbi:MAG TPA: ABC transporter ATP-binding protein [Mycobacteriales bacterium]|nr:ABC transporter ATP-binding protein [Mycobacteriales bacterium]